MKDLNETYDVIVCGGGMSGFCAALSAARAGAATCLVHNRPVLGGNASSEMRVTVHGAACHHPYARETGILGEAMRAERRSNHLFPNENGWTNSVFDLTLYDLVQNEPNLTLHLNTDVWDVEFTDGSRGLERLPEWDPATAETGYLLRPAAEIGLPLQTVHARVQNAEVSLRLEGTQFLDCTGDALVAHLAGCEWRMGSESREETGEIHATESASTDTMGNSIHIRCVDTGRPTPYQAPSWAVQHDDASYFYEQGRTPNDPKGGYWWIEIGVPWDTIHDNETIRHELTRHALGVWDWMKNKDPKMKPICENYALDFIGQVPGKRESRRVIGEHFLNENELQSRKVFPDECAYGGWFIDLHTPGGLLADSSEPNSAAGYDDKRADVALKLIGPYGIPLRSLISKDVPNLMMAGRNISTTHAALGTVRVMGTCGLMGEAAGLAAAIAVRETVSPSEIAADHMAELQQTLLKNGGFLPNHVNQDSKDLAPAAEVRASSSLVYAGQTAGERDPDTGMRQGVWQRCVGRSTPLADSPCLWMFFTEPELNTLSLDLLNDAGKAVSGSVRLVKVDHIWSYNPEEGTGIWQQEIEIPEQQNGWFQVSPSLSRLEAGCYRLELHAEEEAVTWRMSGRHPYGITGGTKVGSGKYHWNRLPGEYAVQVDPPQRIYAPEQVISGVTRPQRSSNLWISARGQEEPWLDLSWETEQTFRQIALTFPAQLLMELHWENPFYVPPMVATQYDLQAWISDNWVTLLEVKDNSEARRIHSLPEPVTTKRLRIAFREVHGHGSAGLTEIRVYG